MQANLRVYVSLEMPFGQACPPQTIVCTAYCAGRIHISDCKVIGSLFRYQRIELCAQLVGRGKLSSADLAEKKV